MQAHDQMQRDWWALQATPLTFTASDIAAVTIFLQDNVDSKQVQSPYLDASLWACHSKLPL